MGYHIVIASIAAFLGHLSIDNCRINYLISFMTLLQPGGKFLTFAYLQGLLLPGGMNFRGKIKSYFPKVTTTKPVWLNTPPAFVYYAQK